MQQLLGASADPHDAPILGLQVLAVMQRRLASLEKQPDVFSLGTETAQAAFTAGIEGQVQLGVPARLNVDSAVNHQHWSASSHEQCCV